MTGMTVTVAVVAMMTVTRAAVVVKGMGAMAALAAVVILGSRDSLDCNGAQGASAYIAPKTPGTARDLPSVFL
jgi:predicted RNA polymerase sigma factor